MRAPGVKKRNYIIISWALVRVSYVALWNQLLRDERSHNAYCPHRTRPKYVSIEYAIKSEYLHV
jgi:hypothetical protein